MKLIDIFAGAMMTALMLYIAKSVVPHHSDDGAITWRDYDLVLWFLVSLIYGNTYMFSKLRRLGEWMETT
jgi:hypothetical protein